MEYGDLHAKSVRAVIDLVLVIDDAVGSPLTGETVNGILQEEFALEDGNQVRYPQVKKYAAYKAAYFLV